MQQTKRAHNGYSNKYINRWQNTTRPITRKCSQKRTRYFHWRPSPCYRASAGGTRWHPPYWPTRKSASKRSVLQMQWKHMLWRPPLLSTKLLKTPTTANEKGGRVERQPTNERERAYEAELFCGKWKWKWNVLGRRIWRERERGWWLGLDKNPIHQ